MTEAEQERAAVVAWLRSRAWRSWGMSNHLRWWQVKLRFANRVASLAQNKVASAIENGDHIRQEGKPPAA